MTRIGLTMLRLFLDYTDKFNLRKLSKTNSAIPGKRRTENII
ncbi:MAG: hypothetical protein GQF41_0249 [Candidatus Rifleibacterium amylolyticum]|nr:MAG: hypothetical protein GQF41_0249 [Candidatus Rifleibacterium amylolyticum]